MFYLFMGKRKVWTRKKRTWRRPCSSSGTTTSSSTELIFLLPIYVRSCEASIGIWRLKNLLHFQLFLEYVRTKIMSCWHDNNNLLLDHKLQFFVLTKLINCNTTCPFELHSSTLWFTFWRETKIGQFQSSYIVIKTCLIYSNFFIHPRHDILLGLIQLCRWLINDYVVELTKF